MICRFHPLTVWDAKISLIWDFSFKILRLSKTYNSDEQPLLVCWISTQGQCVTVYIIKKRVSNDWICEYFLLWISIMQQGSRLKADYEVTWDKDGFFRNTRSETHDKSSRMPPLGAGNYRSDGYRRQPQFSRYSPDNARTKRFKVWKLLLITQIKAICVP